MNMVEDTHQYINPLYKRENLKIIMVEMQWARSTERKSIKTWPILVINPSKRKAYVHVVERKR